MSKVLLTSAAYIKEQTEITDNMEDSKLLPAIRKSQDIELQYVIGSSLLSKLQELIENGTISNPDKSYYKTLLDEYIQPYLAYLVVSEMCLVAGQKIGNFGVVTTSDEHAQSMEMSDRMQLKEYYKNIANSYLDLLQRYITKFHTQFPELNKVDILRIKANLKSSAETSIWLGGKKNPSKRYPGSGRGWVATDILWSDRNL